MAMRTKKEAGSSSQHFYTQMKKMVLKANKLCSTLTENPLKMHAYNRSIKQTLSFFPSWLQTPTIFVFWVNSHMLFTGRRIFTNKGHMR